MPDAYSIRFGGETVPKPIFVALPGTFDAQQKRQIERAGYCFVEASDLAAFKIVDILIEPSSNTHLLKSAMWAIANANTDSHKEGPRTLLGRKLAEHLSKD